MNRTFFPEKRPRWLWLISEAIIAVAIGLLSLCAHWGQLSEGNTFLASCAWVLGWFGYSNALKIATPAPQPSVVISIDRSKLTPEQEADIDDAIEDLLTTAKEAGAIK